MLRHLREMKEIGLEPNTKILNAVMRVWSKRGFHEEILQTFQSMSGGNAIPNDETYSIVFDVLSRKGQLGALLEVHNRLVSEGKVLNLEFYKCAFQNFEYLSGQTEEIIKFFQIVQSRITTPNGDLYSSLILHLMRNGEPALVRKYFMEAQEHKLPFSGQLLNSFAQQFLKNGKLLDAFEQFKVMQTLNVQPSVKTLAYLFVHSFGVPTDTEQLKKFTR